MKNSFLFLFFVFFSYVLTGQTTFKLLISDSTNEWPGDIVELSDHSYVLSSIKFIDTADLASQRFFKISSTGVVTNTSSINNPQGRSTLLSLLYINDTNIICIGDWANLNAKDKKWIVCIDSGFCIRWSKKYQLNYNYSYTATTFLNSKNRIISAARTTNWDPPDLLLFQEYSIMGDSLLFKYDSSVTQPMIFDMMEFPVNDIYLAAVGGYHHNSLGQVLTIDSTLSIVNVDSIPNSVYWYNALKKLNDSSYYISGNKHVDLMYYGYAIMNLDENNDCNRITTISQHDTMNYAGTTQSMDFLDNSKIFLGSTSNFSFAGHYGEQNSWYALSSLDSSLNLRWTKYYGGDSYYFLQSVVATKDGGAIMVGTRYDYPTQSYQYDIFIVKVDENGVITSSDPVQASVVHEAIVYPNPGSDHLTVESGPQISGAEFRMMTLEGKQIFSQTLSERRENLVTQFLSPGIYPWQVILHERVVESGKWIKK